MENDEANPFLKVGKWCNEKNGCKRYFRILIEELLKKALLQYSLSVAFT